MPKSRSGASSRSLSSSKPAPKPTTAASKAPTPVKQTPPPAAAPQTPAAPQQVVVQGPGMLATIGSSMAGAAAGHVLGHAIVGVGSSLFGGNKDNGDVQQPMNDMSQQQQPQQYNQSNPENLCNPLYKSFMTCLEKNQNDITTCQWAYDSFLECKKNPGQNFY